MSALGFDTSNYTTSVAWFGNGQEKSQRRILPVKPGERGLRQSNAVFSHMKALPELFELLMAELLEKKISAIGVSTRPRSVEGSYMPVFLAGEGFARVTAATLGVPLYRFSHQDGHLMAGIYSGSFYDLLEGEFLSVHLSGGTTEILKCAYCGNGFSAEILGGTKDISAGQLIDRIGVQLGLQFPCGRELETLADKTQECIKVPVSTDGCFMNLSGLENKFSAMITNREKSIIARSVFEAVAKSLANTVRAAVAQTDSKRVLIVGGVASNAIIRSYLEQNVEAELFFAKPEYATDNAVGIAALAERI